MYRALYRRALTAACMLSMLTATSALAAAAPTTPELMLTWSTDSFVPATYPGARLPTKGSGIAVAAQLIDNQKLMPIGDATVQWYINDSQAGSGVGLSTLTFNTDDFSARSGLYDIQAIVRGYGEKQISARVLLPRTSPLLIITTPLPGRSVVLSGTVITALPYFFNAASLSDLSFTWEAAGARQTSTGNTLTFAAPNQRSGGQITITAIAAMPDRTRAISSITTPAY